VLVRDGEIAATWRRRDRHLTFAPFPGHEAADLAEAVAEAAAALPLPGAPENTIVDWDLN
jgi:hypothetical protein